MHSGTLDVTVLGDSPRMRGMETYWSVYLARVMGAGFGVRLSSCCFDMSSRKYVLVWYDVDTHRVMSANLER